MPFGRSILLAAARSRRLNDFALKSEFVKRATRTFMPGERAEDALEAGAAIGASGRGLLFTQLGEAITSPVAAIAVRNHYLWLFDQIGTRRLPAHVSVKPTQLGLDLSGIDAGHLQCWRPKRRQSDQRSGWTWRLEYVDRATDLTLHSGESSIDWDRASGVCVARR